jgi:CBS domain-containing protein
MSIYVIEQGRRVATPVDALFPRNVQSVVRSARVEPVEGEAAGNSAQLPPSSQEAAAGISAYREQSLPPAARHRASTAADVMTPQPLCLVPDAMVSSAWQIMQQRGFHHVLVAATDMTLLGIVSDRDIWELLAASASMASVPSAQDMARPAFEAAAQLQDSGQLGVAESQREAITPAGLAAMATTRVDAVMISQVVCASAETSIRRVAEVMLLHKVDALPVTDDAQHVQGIVTRTDLLRALVLEAPLELWV